ncbi:hypothetical protein F4819DRAFT_228170 [Hypoxylon fuscum]|nr:hypothetical protein F4819DRAFT_228170 [Hypoxylon fuscum]
MVPKVRITCIYLYDTPQATSTSRQLNHHIPSSRQRDFPTQALLCHPRRRRDAVRSCLIVRLDPEHRGGRPRCIGQLRERERHGPGTLVEAEALDTARVCRDHDAQRPDEDPPTHGAGRLHADPPRGTAVLQHAAVRQQAPSRVARDVGAGGEGRAEEAGAVVAAVGVPGQRGGPRVERRGREPSLVDAGQRRAGAGEPDLQQVRV